MDPDVNTDWLDAIEEDVWYQEQHHPRGVRTWDMPEGERKVILPESDVLELVALGRRALERGIL